MSRRFYRYAGAFLVIASLNFLIPRLMPGDPVANLLGEEYFISEATMAELRQELGLDLPLHRQFLAYWRDLIRLDLGYSYHLHLPVFQLIVDRSIWTMLLAVPSIMLGGFTGVVAGALAGWRETRLAKTLTFIIMAVYSTPAYFLALMLLYIFAFQLNLFPLKGFYSTGGLLDLVHHLALPVTVLTLFLAARNYMIMRGSVMQEKDQLYVTYARSRGYSQAATLWTQVFRNALLPAIPLIALDFGFAFSGALFIEIIFSLNGMGTLIYEAAMARDYPLLQGALLVISLAVIVANYLAEKVYNVLDPRTRWAG